MKHILFIFFVFPLVALSQKIKSNDYDEILKKRVIITTESTLKEDKEANMYVSLKAVDTSFYLVLQGNGLGAGTIKAGDAAIFLLDNNNTITATSTAAQTYDVNNKKNSYSHEYRLTLKDIKRLSQYNLKAVRKYEIQGYTDITIPEAHEFDLRKTSLLLLSELVTSKVISSEAASYTYIKSIDLEDVSRHIGDSVSVCGKVLSSYYLKSALNKPTLLTVGTNTQDLLTLVIYEADRKNFKEAVEKYFLDKDICISGRLEMKNNKAQIVIRKEQDLSLKDTTVTKR